MCCGKMQLQTGAITQPVLLHAMQVQRPTLLINLRFIQGSFTFVGLAAVPCRAASRTSAAAAFTAADIAQCSQQACLPQKLQEILTSCDVFLPDGVTRSEAAASGYFVQAQQHRVSPGFWTKNNNLTTVLSLLMHQKFAHTDPC